MDQVEVEMVLECSGNGRTEYRDTPGTPWGHGGVANVRFGGVPLSAVLDRHGVTVDPRARYVTAEGQGTPTQAGSTRLRAQPARRRCPGEEHPGPDAERRAAPRHPRWPGPPGDAGLLRHHATQVAEAASLRDGRVADLLPRDRVPGPAVPGPAWRALRIHAREQPPDLVHPPDELHPRPVARRDPGGRLGHRERRRVQRRGGAHRIGRGVGRSRPDVAARRNSNGPTAPMPGIRGRRRSCSSPAPSRSGREPRTSLAAPSHSMARSTGTRTATSGPACSRRTSRSSDRAGEWTHGNENDAPVTGASLYVCQLGRRALAYRRSPAISTSDDGRSRGVHLAER